MVRPQPGRSGLVFLVCLAVGVAEAALVQAPPVEELDAELLDFLGSWQDDQGRWVDPFTKTEADNHVAPAPAEPKPDHHEPPEDARKPGRKTPTMPTQDHARDPLRMHTRP
ncbi:MAG: hypothetical protein GDA68_12005 [Nitrospira sp. CR2.1]|nr:hypothetical protein [Nitrospira sp. CR2.1]